VTQRILIRDTVQRINYYSSFFTTTEALEELNILFERKFETTNPRIGIVNTHRKMVTC
jgi:hypothetical protein